MFSVGYRYQNTLFPLWQEIFTLFLPSNFFLSFYILKNSITVTPDFLLSPHGFFIVYAYSYYPLVFDYFIGVK